MKFPYIDLYPGDWLKDPVAGCSLAAQGLWLRLMFIMHESPKRGFLCQILLEQNSSKIFPLLPESLARRCGCSLPEFQTVWDELVGAGVPRRGCDGIWYCKRMVEDQRLREVRMKAGRAGGKASADARFAQAKPQANIGLDWVGTSKSTSRGNKGGGGETGVQQQSKVPRGSQAFETASNDALTHTNASLTHTNPPKPDLGGWKSEYADYKRCLATIFKRNPDKAWAEREDRAFAASVQFPGFQSELIEIQTAYRKGVAFMPTKLYTLLEGWDGALDTARGNRASNGKPGPKAAFERNVDRICAEAERNCQ